MIPQAPIFAVLECNLGELVRKSYEISMMMAESVGITTLVWRGGRLFIPVYSYDPLDYAYNLMWMQQNTTRSLFYRKHIHICLDDLYLHMWLRGWGVCNRFIFISKSDHLLITAGWIVEVKKIYVQLKKISKGVYDSSNFTLYGLYDIYVQYGGHGKK